MFDRVLNSPLVWLDICVNQMENMIETKGGFISLLKDIKYLTISWWKFLSYRNKSIYLLCKSVDWFLYDRSIRH